MSKRTISSILSVFMIFSSWIQPVRAEEPEPIPEDAAGEAAELLNGSYENLNYEVTGDTVQITGYTGEPVNLTIPDTIDGLPVDTIGSSAFSNCDTLQSVSIPDTVTTISNSAFYGCSSLAEVTLEEGLVTIGNNAFQYCNQLRRIVIPDSVRSIGSEAFSNCDLRTAILPDGITSLPEYLFMGNSGMMAVVIPSSVTTISSYAFGWIHDIKKVVYKGTPEQWNGISIWDGNEFNNFEIQYEGEPAEVILNQTELTTEIESTFQLKAVLTDDQLSEGPFVWSSSDESVAAVDETGMVTGIGRGNAVITAATQDGSVSAECTVKVTGPTSTGTYEHLTYRIYHDEVSIQKFDNEVESVVIPEEIEGYPVISINANAFENCDRLVSVVMPDGVTNLDWMQFSNCTNLKEVHLPAGLTSLGSSVFQNCTSLEEITIPDEVTSIGLGSFYGCTGLKSVHIPADVTVIQDYAFNSCDALEFIYFGGTEEQWSQVSIQNNNQPLYSATVIASDTTAGIRLNSTSLNLNIGDTYQLSAHIILDEEEENVFTWTSSDPSVASVDNEGLVTAAGKGDARITVQTTSGKYSAACDITVIKPIIYGNDGSFNYKIQDDEVTITSLVSDAGLNDAVIPDEIQGYPVTGIENSAFSGKTELSSVTLPSTLRWIGSNAFSGCFGLTNISIPDGLESIGDYAFTNCSSLKRIVLPNSVTSIGKELFTDCFSLKTAVLPDGITVIPDQLFYNSALKAVVIPASVTEISYYALGFINLQAIVFKGTSKQWNNITLGEGNEFSSSIIHFKDDPAEIILNYTNIITEMENTFQLSAFLTNETLFDGPFNWSSSDENVASVDETGMVTGIGRGNAVITASTPDGTYSAECTVKVTGPTSAGTYEHLTYRIYHDEVSIEKFDNEVESVVIPEEIEGYPVTGIYSNAFENCDRLVSVVMPDRVTNLNWMQFSNCTNLKEVHLPAGLTSVGDSVFQNCTSLEEITIPDGVTSIGNGAFYGCSGLKCVAIPDSVSLINNDAFNSCNALEYLIYSGTKDQWYSTMVYSGNSPLSSCTLITSETEPGVILRQTALSLTVGDTSQLSARIIKDEDEEKTLEWSSSDPTVASVSNDGLVTAVGKGTARITVQTVSGKYSAYCDVTVSSPVINGNDGTYNYRIQDDEVKIISMSSGKTEAVIPDEIEGYPVTGIADEAFKNHSELTSVTLPSNLRWIGTYAFYCCSGLKEITFPDGLESIGQLAFTACQLERIVLPESVTSIGDSAFSSNNLKTAVISGGITEFPGDLFWSNGNLIAIVIPDTVTTIVSRAFTTLSSLKKIVYKGTREQWENINIAEDSELGDTAVQYKGEPVFFLCLPQPKKVPLLSVPVIYGIIFSDK